MENKKEIKSASKDSYTKEEVNTIVLNAIKVFSNTVKNKMTKAVVLTMLAEIKPKTVDNKITYQEIEKVGFELIKRVKEYD